jgi:hypothetical protein
VQCDCETHCRVVPLDQASGPVTGNRHEKASSKPRCPGSMTLPPFLSQWMRDPGPVRFLGGETRLSQTAFVSPQGSAFGPLVAWTTWPFRLGNSERAKYGMETARGNSAMCAPALIPQPAFAETSLAHPPTLSELAAFQTDTGRDDFSQAGKPITEPEYR